MTIGGIIIMTLSVGLVTLLFVWCLYKVFSAPENAPSKMHGFEQETPDTEHFHKEDKS